MIPRRMSLAIVLIGVGLVSLVVGGSLLPRGYSMEAASQVAEDYLRSLQTPDLAIDEIMEFEQNFYVLYYEPSTGIGAFEMLIDRANGRIFPEYGPNMMWNTKYGHGGNMWGPNGVMGPGGMMGSWGYPYVVNETVDGAEAMAIAQRFLDSVYPGTEVGDLHPFYGYYTLHVLKDGAIYGMLSVNEYDGTVWYHNWHGDFLSMKEYE